MGGQREKWGCEADPKQPWPHRGSAATVVLQRCPRVHRDVQAFITPHHPDMGGPPWKELSLHEATLKGRQMEAAC